MDPNELLEALEPVLDAYQRSSPTRRSSTFIEDTVDELYQAVEEFRAKWQQEEDGQQTEDDVLNCLSDVLVHFFDCTISEENTAGCKDSIDAIFQLLTTVAAKRFVLVRELLDRAIECSGVLLERVRACACQFIGLQVSVLLSTEMLNVAERDELLDQASQALIPRITDKAQSVRLAYIQAASCFFSSSNEGDESQTEDDDPELRQGLQWSLQHDPSVTNRVAALEALPATVQTSDLIISRLRDVKPRVRHTAVEILEKFNVASQLDAAQCAFVIEAGHSNRCEETRDKIVDLICTRWMKEFDFDPIRLLSKIGVVEHESSCEKLVRILLNVSKQHLSTLLSKTEYRSYWDELESAGARLLNRSQKHELELTRLFYTRVRCQTNSDDPNSQGKQNEDFLSSILPDVPTLCELFEVHAMALMKVIVDDEQAFIVQNEEEMACVCMNLSQLFELVDLEEGSRLHLKATMKRMLGSVLTPDDLIEGCVRALRHVVGDREDEYWDDAVEIAQSLDSRKNETEDAVEDAYTMRIVAILSTVCETSSSQLSNASDIQASFYSFVLPAASHTNALVREAAVVCFGRLGMFAGSELLSDKYASLMAEFASNETEPLEIRIQALLALTDWAMISASESFGILESLLEMVPQLLQDSHLSVVCAVAEVALRLLFSGKVVESEWIGKLVFLFFDPRLLEQKSETNGECGDGINDVGNPERLQQMLSLFFPAFCLRSVRARDAFVGCASTVLELCLKKDSQKRKRGTKAVPVSRILDYVLATANVAADSNEGHESEERETAADATTPSVLIALQLAIFISQRQQDCSILLLRTLCKNLGKMELDLDRERSWNHLSHLKDTLEDLETELTDSSCLRSMQALSEDLSKLELPKDGDRSASLVKGMERLNIATVDDTENQEPNRICSTGETTSVGAEKDAEK